MKREGYEGRRRERGEGRTEASQGQGKERVEGYDVAGMRKKGMGWEKVRGLEQDVLVHLMRSIDAFAKAVHAAGCVSNSRAYKQLAIKINI